MRTNHEHRPTGAERSTDPAADRSADNRSARERDVDERSAASERAADGKRNGDGRAGTQPPLAYLKLADALVYAIEVAFVVLVVAALASFAVGGGWGGVKYLLFFVGFFLFGVTALRLRPAGAWSEGDNRSSPNREETRFQAIVQATPPLRRYDLAPGERLPIAPKLFVASLVVLGISFAMETFFGVAA